MISGSGKAERNKDVTEFYMSSCKRTFSVTVLTAMAWNFGAVWGNIGD